jgi:dTMP kinase
MPKKKEPTTGFFVVIEGIEGSGKSTQADLLAQRLRESGRPVVLTFEPGATALGARLRSLLLGIGGHASGVAEDAFLPPERAGSRTGEHNPTEICGVAELFLYLADRAQHVEEVLLPSLQARKIVICDRFNDSTIAYQGAGRGLGMQQIAELCKFASYGLEPDLVIVLDLDPETAISRLDRREQPSRDRIEGEPIEFHRRVREAYLTLAESGGDRYWVVDASNDPGTVAHEVHAEVVRRLESRGL